MQACAVKSLVQKLIPKSKPVPEVRSSSSSRSSTRSSRKGTRPRARLGSPAHALALACRRPSPRCSRRWQPWR
eukprot:scaffold1023_cov292-Prasinococcus_capsulatus_cf.AAC.2